MNTKGRNTHKFTILSGASALAVSNGCIGAMPYLYLPSYLVGRRENFLRDQLHLGTLWMKWTVVEVSMLV